MDLDALMPVDTGTSTEMDVDVNIDIDMNFSSKDVPSFVSMPTQAAPSPALASVPFTGQTVSTSEDMNVDVAPSETICSVMAGEGIERGIAVSSSSAISVSLLHSETQPRTLAGHQTLPAPAPPSPSPSPSPLPPPSPSSLQLKKIDNPGPSSGISSNTSSSSSLGSEMNHAALALNPASTPAPAPNCASLSPIDSAISSLSKVPVAARVDDVGSVDMDVGQDDGEHHSPIPAVDKGKGKQKADLEEPGQGGGGGEVIHVANASIDFDWDKEADRFYNGEYDDELEENEDYDDEYDDDSDYWGSGEDGFTDDESESESGSGSRSGKKSKFKVVDEFGFDMLSFAKMLYESGEMEIMEREAYRSASPAPSTASSSRSPSPSPPPSSRSPTPEPLDPDFPDLDDMDDVSIEEMNKHLKGLKVVKVQKIGENCEKISFDWTDSGDETKESEVEGVGMGIGVPRLVWTSPTPPQSPARQSAALPGVDALGPACATSISSASPPSSVSTSRSTLPLRRLPAPFPPQQIPDTERLKVPPPQFTRGNRRVALERFVWERQEWLRRYHSVRVLWGEKKSEEVKEKEWAGILGSKKEGRAYRRLPKRIAGQRMLTRSMSRSPSPRPGVSELMKFESSWMGESSRGPVTRSMSRSPSPGPGVSGEERKFTLTSSVRHASSKPKPRSKRKAEEVDGRARVKVKTEEGADADMETETDIEADGPKTRYRSRSATRRMSDAKEDVKKEVLRGRGRGRTPKIRDEAFSVKVEVDADANGKPWEVWRGILTNAANFADSKPMRIRTRSRSRELERFGSHWDERSAMRRSARLSVGKKEKTRKGMRVRKEGMYMGGY